MVEALERVSSRRREWRVGVAEAEVEPILRKVITMTQ